MRLFAGTALVALAALAATAAQPPAAWGCSCAGEPPETWLARSDGAFVGTVLDWRVDDRSGSTSSSGDPAFATFRVERAVKGTLPRELVVRTVRSTATCGLDVRVGQRVGLLLEQRGREWTSGLCAQFPPAALKRLPATGRVAAAVSAPEPDGGARRVAAASLAVLGGVACAAAAAVTVRRSPGDAAPRP